MEVNKSIQKRADALDALRGFAILTMILSGSIPFAGALPGWMYHAQLPPPEHVFNPAVPGITWVDLVFPFFLFSMGVAFPFALRKKIDGGIAKWKISLQVLQRGFLLAGFAIFIQHFKPYALNSSPEATDWLLGLVGFGLLFMMLTRFPKTINKNVQIGIKGTGLISSVILLSFLQYSNGSGFNVGRSDIIILVLANVAVGGSIVWIFTRNNMLLRLGILAFLFALRVTHGLDDSWTSWLWNATPFPWLYKLYYMQYLFIVIPGTIIGDLVYDWMNSTKDNNIVRESSQRMISLMAVSSGLILINLICLYSRLLILNVALSFLLVGFGYLLTKDNTSSLGKLYKAIFSWGSFWLLLGLFFESFEGGIKKDPSNVTYYLTTTGLACFAYITLSIIIEYFGKKKYLQLMIDNGQNPMIAYIGGSNFIMPILALTSLDTILIYLLINPWLGFIKGCIFTLLVALVTQYFTKRKLFWRT
jgi:predicted acyltransferase